MLLGDAENADIRRVAPALKHAVGLNQRHDRLYAVESLKLGDCLLVQRRLARGAAAVSAADIGPGVDADGRQTAGSGKAFDGCLLDADTEGHHDHDGRNTDDHTEHGQERPHFSPPQVQKRCGQQIADFHCSSSCAVSRRMLTGPRARARVFS
ncbi:hypothetical protein SDC9_116583 [bioreactor metagenome]|uniref:Uncharacterized protein n=1 Tax=bioreactor metagenome TaxID=1076179 RepID=A0A645BWK4_9ZZZZ